MSKKETAEVLADHRKFEVIVDVAHAYSLVLAIQLATRHPNIGDDLARIFESVGRQYQDKIAEFRPDVAHHLEFGWDRYYDVDVID